MPDPVLAWCDDIHSVRGNVSQLQATLNQLVLKTPTVAQYKELINTYGSPEADATTEAPHILEKLRSIMNSPQVKVAVRLRNLYERGYLPFLLGLSRINFRSQKCDRYVGYLLDFTPPKVDTSNTFPAEGSFMQKEVTFLQKEGNYMQKEETHPDGFMYPPTLPPIENQSLLQLVFTDKSLRQASDFLESEFADGFHDYNNNHNRKLMLRGKNILNLVLLDILDESFPKVHEDDLEYLKYRLTSTEILAKLAFSYNFSDPIMHQIAQEASLEEKLTVFRNVFLAYIGGLSKSEYTYSAIRLWISRLYEPLISRLQLDEYKTQFKDVHNLAYAELQFMLRRVNSLTEEPTRRMRYEFRARNKDLDFPMACQLIVCEEELGIGSGQTMEEAKKKACYETLESSELCSRLMSILIKQFRKPNKEKSTAAPKEAAADSKLENGSEDESYSPGISADDYDPEESHKTNNKSDNLKPQPAPSVPINYSDTPSQVLANVRSNGNGKQPHSAQQNFQKQLHPPQKANIQMKANTQPPASQPQVRMPLPYGKLPPIPNMKKKGGKS